jgi:hypothetical protein
MLTSVRKPHPGTVQTEPIKREEVICLGRLIDSFNSWQLQPQMGRTAENTENSLEVKR